MATNAPKEISLGSPPKFLPPAPPLKNEMERSTKETVKLEQNTRKISDGLVDAFSIITSLEDKIEDMDIRNPHSKFVLR